MTIGSGLTALDNYLFYRCSTLETVGIPSTITSIGQYTFTGCSALDQIEISESITSIGKYAFSNCESLAEITVPATVTTIGEYVIGYNVVNSELLHNENTTIYGYYDSIAEQYAEAYEVPFVALDAPTTTETPVATTTTQTDAETPSETTATGNTPAHVSAYGDVNLDGNVNTADVILLNKAALNLVELSDNAKVSSDLNLDGSIDSTDAMILLKFNIQLIQKLPYVDET